MTERKEAPGHHWQAPPLGSLKLNVDAAIGDGNNGTGLGAVIRDAAGMVVVAYSRKIQNPFDPLTTECVAIRDGLRFAKARGLHVTEVESDSMVAIQTIQSLTHPLALDSLMSEI